MQAVSDTSPLFNLAAIGQLHLLAQQFESILIPPAVLAEMGPVRDTVAAESIRRAIDEGSIRVAPVENQHLVRSLKVLLDPGEAEALALALESAIGTVLMDEKEGRRIARDLGLTPVGVLGLLLRAKRRGQLDSVGDAMSALQERAGFYIAAHLFAEVLEAAGED
jgi:predicted nucleic acid-binding protein